jgi:ATP-dependent helicase/nuclease subunit B
LESPVLRVLALPPSHAASSGEGEGGRGPGEEAVQALRQLGEFPAFAPLIHKWREVTSAAEVQRLAAPVAGRLHGNELQTSVSGLEDFAACPFKYFAARGLRLEERKEFQFDARDQGSFQHEVLREFHERVRATGRLWRHLGVVEARVMVTNLAHDLITHFEHGKFQGDGAARFMGGVLIERLGDLVEALIEWMAQYAFDPVLAELGFGLEAEGLPAWRLELTEGRALCLRGRIDRVDMHRTDDDTALVVVMDYKSRARKLNSTKLHHGLELQLLSYLGVLRHLAAPEKFFAAKKVSPVGVFYVPLNGGAASSGSTRSEVVASDPAERRVNYQHSGRFLADVLPLLDARGASKGDQFKYARKQDGSLAARGNEALPRIEFESLCEKIENHLREHGRRIFAGEVAVSPFRIGKETACEHCDFRPICRFDPWTQPYRNLRLPGHL